jgi:hypothetical protein
VVISLLSDEKSLRNSFAILAKSVPAVSRSLVGDNLAFCIESHDQNDRRAFVAQSKSKLSSPMSDVPFKSRIANL